MDDCPADLIPTRKSLLGRLKNWEDTQGWRTFFDTYWKLIYGFALKSGLSHEEAEEVVQETVLAVARNIGNFKYDPAVSSFKNWLLTVTRSKIADLARRRERRPVMAEPPPVSCMSGTPWFERQAEPAEAVLEGIWEDEWQRNLMDAALQRVKGKVAGEHYQIFDLAVLKQWPARKIAATLGVSMAAVYVAKHRVGKLVRKEVQALEEKGI
jgi:RNA polymerase sigma-70 factor (ECF subfamily)